MQQEQQDPSSKTADATSEITPAVQPTAVEPTAAAASATTSVVASHFDKIITTCPSTYNDDTVLLHVILEGFQWCHGSASPFCLKLEAYLRFAKIKFVYNPTTQFSSSPKGKMPFIEHKGKKIGDSSLIIEYLSQIYGDIDSHLTRMYKKQATTIFYHALFMCMWTNLAQQRGMGRMMQRLLEDHLYWIVVYLRWCYKDEWLTQYRNELFKNGPWVVNLVPNFALRANMNSTLKSQGLGRHSTEEIVAFAKQDIDAISCFVPSVESNQMFLFGDKPSSYDSVLYAFIICLLEGYVFAKITFTRK